MKTANEKKAMKALAWISGCRFWNTFTRISPPMMNMKAVSKEEKEGEEENREEGEWSGGGKEGGGGEGKEDERGEEKEGEERREVE